MRAAPTIRDATIADAPAIAAIYAHHVLTGVATFELTPPEANEIAARMKKVLDAGHPWLVACDARGAVVGYAYASCFHDRVAYELTCEDSIYVADDARGQGVGTMLLAALLDAAQARGFRQMIAILGGDNPASVALHTRAGFREVGHLTSVGRKHGRWLDTFYLQRALGPGDASEPEREPT